MTATLLLQPVSADEAAALTAVANLVNAIAWPLVVATVLVALVRSRAAAGLLSSYAPRVRKLGLGGVAIEFSEEAAVELRGTAQDTFLAYRRSMKSEFDRLAYLHRVGDKTAQVARTYVRPWLEKHAPRPVNPRCTVHVPDALFADSYYQLLDYYPHGGGAGRAFSARFGIAGLAWRTGRNQRAGEVPTDPVTLIREWSMTMEEAAEAGQRRHSFLCVVLHDRERTPVGVFYMDAVNSNAFEGRRGHALEDTIQLGAEKTGLIEALSRLDREVRQRGAAIQIYDQD